ncbi:MAG: hypothetical protein KAI47_04740, partial [Deltaproteobacteria bacterium]|nr:hypothetical protein [Deltaproteobacteria bacterium]
MTDFEGVNIVKRWTLGAAIITGALLLVFAGSAKAQVLSPAQDASIKAKKIYRGSSVTYENIFNARAIDPGAQLSYNPYYAQSLTFMPQIWLRNDMFLRARLSVEVELTLSDSTDTKREPVLSDIYLDYMWLSAYTIPKLKIAISPLL